MAQADAPYRDSIEDVAGLCTRNANGEMVPIGSMVTLSEGCGPDPVLRYNGFPAADLAGEADPRVLSSAAAMDAIRDIGDRLLPAGMGFEWTDLSFQQASQSGTAWLVFPLAVLLVFLVLAALYESWILPLAVILIVPICMLSALAGMWLTGARRDRWPSVTAGAGASETRPSDVEQGPGAEKFETYEAGLAAEWELDPFGRLRPATSACAVCSSSATSCGPTFACRKNRSTSSMRASQPGAARISTAFAPAPSSRASARRPATATAPIESFSMEVHERTILRRRIDSEAIESLSSWKLFHPSGDRVSPRTLPESRCLPI